MEYVTFIHTIEPATGRTMMRPACEMYRTIEQTRRNVERREYQSGIATWITYVRVHYSRLQQIGELDEIF